MDLSAQGRAETRVSASPEWAGNQVARQVRRRRKRDRGRGRVPGGVSWTTSPNATGVPGCADGGVFSGGGRDFRAETSWRTAFGLKTRRRRVTPCRKAWSGSGPGARILIQRGSSMPKPLDGQMVELPFQLPEHGGQARVHCVHSVQGLIRSGLFQQAGGLGRSGGEGRHRPCSLWAAFTQCARVPVAHGRRHALQLARGRASGTRRSSQPAAPRRRRRPSTKCPSRAAGRRRATVPGFPSVGPRRGGQDPLQHIEQFPAANRLADKIVHARLEAAFAISFHRPGGQRDDGQAPAGRSVRAGAGPDYLKAVQLRHVDVEQQQIEAVLLPAPPGPPGRRGDLTVWPWPCRSAARPAWLRSLSSATRMRSGGAKQRRRSEAPRPSARAPV